MVATNLSLRVPRATQSCDPWPAQWPGFTPNPILWWLWVQTEGPLSLGTPTHLASS